MKKRLVNKELRQLTTQILSGVMTGLGQFQRRVRTAHPHLAGQLLPLTSRYYDSTLTFNVPMIKISCDANKIDKFVIIEDY